MALLVDQTKEPAGGVGNIVALGVRNIVAPGVGNIVALFSP